MGIQNGILTSSTILMNPSSMSSERAKELEEKLNKKFVTEYNFEWQNYVQLASQVIIPLLTVVKPLKEEMSKLKLAFLNTLIREYEPNYNKSVNIEVENENKS